jgi:hypothetical protein
MLGIWGKLGSGRFILLKSILHRLQVENKESHFFISYFYSITGVVLQASLVRMYRTLLYQLLSPTKTISRYINSKFKEILYDEMDTPLLTSLVSAILKRSSRFFLWVVFVVNYVVQIWRVGGKMDDLHRLIDALLLGLEDLYANMIRSLTLEELRYALVLDDSLMKDVPWPASCEKSPWFIEDDLKVLKRMDSLTGGLAEVVTDTDQDGGSKTIIQFIYPTFIEFFKTYRFKYLDEYIPDDSPGVSHQRPTRSYGNYVKLNTTNGKD